MYNLNLNSKEKSWVGQMKMKEAEMKKIMDVYNQYDLCVSGDINGKHAWDIIAEMEQKYPVDDIMLLDGTRLWNIIRIFLYTFHQEHTGKRNLNVLSFVVDMPLRVILHRLLHRRYPLQGEEVLMEIADDVVNITGVDREQFLSSLFDYIMVFADMKHHYHHQLIKAERKIKYGEDDQEVRLSCGYGRLPMAKAQACRELSIQCIEEQHGVIDELFPAYRRATPTDNHDCIPEHIEVFDERFAELIRTGHLFKPENVRVVGAVTFQRRVLFTGQWILAEETRTFLTQVAKLLDKNITVLFMPHSQDDNNYDDLWNLGIILLDKDADFFEELRRADVHATVFSGRGYFSLTHGTPTLFVDLLKLVKPSASVVQTPEEFVNTVNKIIKEKEQ